MVKLSVVVPVFNEEKTVEKILRIIDSVKIDKEIIVVNDCSSDKTQEILSGLKIPGLKIITHQKNMGKGAAFMTGLKNSRGEIVIIQDADLEYDPCEYYKLVAPIENKEADLVLGIRFTKGYKGLFFHRLGNLFLTKFFNLLFHSKLNDVYTCYKVARRDVFNDLHIRSNDYSIEQEIIIKSIKRGLKIKEVPIAYYPRSYSQGKKIRYHDGLKVLIQMLRSKFKGE